MATRTVEFLENVIGDTWFHKIDPRTKILFIVAYLAAEALFIDLMPLLIILLTTVPFWIIARVKLRPILLQVVSIVTMMGTVFLMYGLWLPRTVRMTAEAYYQLGPLIIDKWTLQQIGLPILRVMISTGVALLVTVTTDPVLFARGMTKLRVPVEVSFMILAGLRMFPLIFVEAANIAAAQLIRGVKTKGLINKIKKMKLLIGPLFINSLRRSRTLGVAVECKGFGSRSTKTFLRTHEFARRDYYLIVYLAILVTVCLYVRFVLGFGWTGTTGI